MSRKQQQESPEKARFDARVQDLADHPLAWPVDDSPVEEEKYLEDAKGRAMDSSAQAFALRGPIH